MKLLSILAAAILCFLYSGCSNGSLEYDAAGAFESVETIVSTEAAGTLMQFDIEEGQTLNLGQWVGYVDSTQLYYRKQQLQAQIGSTVSQKPDIPVQLVSLQSQL